MPSSPIPSNAECPQERALLLTPAATSERSSKEPAQRRRVMPRHSERWMCHKWSPRSRRRMRNDSTANDDMCSSVLPGLNMAINMAINMATVTPWERDLFLALAPSELQDPQMLMGAVVSGREEMMMAASAVLELEVENCGGSGSSSGESDDIEGREKGEVSREEGDNGRIRISGRMVMTDDREEGGGGGGGGGKEEDRNSTDWLCGDEFSEFLDFSLMLKGETLC